MILDLGGKDEGLDWRILRYIDYISPNETELEKIRLGGIQLIKQDPN